MEQWREELYHHGIMGMHWGIRRFQNEDGSLTPEGERRYESSLSKTYQRDNEDDDYVLQKGSSVFRRVDSSKNDGFDKDAKYTYTYDYDNKKDDDFYTQFGRKVSEYSLNDNSILAGKTTLGKTFVDKMLSLTDKNDIRAMRPAYQDACKRTGEEYIKNLFAMPYEPQKHIEQLQRLGANITANLIASQRHESADAEEREDGLRDGSTARNDIGRSIIDNLLLKGYSGMRDYHDYGSIGARVNTPTILFDPNKKLNKKSTWFD